jgi:subtilisin family serine protease
LKVYDIEGGYDFFSVNYKIGTGDPFVTGQQLLRISGSFSNPWYHDYYPFPFDISSYTGTNCSIGFRLQSDGSYQYTGVAIRNFAIVNANTSVINAYEVMDGTSMASPYVAGLAAMLIAFNPDYTYQDAANALKNGGETVASLAGITTTGKAINAWGSLKYINTPAGLSVQQIQ